MLNGQRNVVENRSKPLPFFSFPPSLFPLSSFSLSRPPEAMSVRNSSDKIGSPLLLFSYLPPERQQDATDRSDFHKALFFPPPFSPLFLSPFSLLADRCHRLFIRALFLGIHLYSLIRRNSLLFPFLPFPPPLCLSIAKTARSPTRARSAESIKAMLLSLFFFFSLSPHQLDREAPSTR